MFDLIAPVVVLHVIAAVSAILIGLVPLVDHKGGRLHNRAGLTYCCLQSSSSIY